MNVYTYDWYTLYSIVATFASSSLSSWKKKYTNENIIYN